MFEGSNLILLELYLSLGKQFELKFEVLSEIEKLLRKSKKNPKTKGISSKVSKASYSILSATSQSLKILIKFFLYELVHNLYILIYLVV